MLGAVQLVRGIEMIMMTMSLTGVAFLMWAPRELKGSDRWLEHGKQIALLWRVIVSGAAGGERGLLDGVEAHFAGYRSGGCH